MALTGGAARSSNEEDLLADVRLVFAQRGNVEKILTSEIRSALAQMDDRPWATHDRGKTITPHALAKVLKNFEAAPRQWKVGIDRGRGYYLADLQPAFAKYLEPLPAAEAEEPSEYDDIFGNEDAEDAAD